MELINDFLKRLRNESGSISLVVMSLFIVSLTSILVITDVAAVAIAKRSLTQATEAAAQRGVRNLDTTSYYRGEFDATTQARNLFGIGPCFFLKIEGLAERCRDQQNAPLHHQILRHESC